MKCPVEKRQTTLPKCLVSQLIVHDCYTYNLETGNANIFSFSLPLLLILHLNCVTTNTAKAPGETFSHLTFAFRMLKDALMGALVDVKIKLFQNQNQIGRNWVCYGALCVLWGFWERAKKKKNHLKQRSSKKGCTTTKTIKYVDKNDVCSVTDGFTFHTTLTAYLYLIQISAGSSHLTLSDLFFLFIVWINSKVTHFPPPNIPLLFTANIIPPAPFPQEITRVCFANCLSVKRQSLT